MPSVPAKFRALLGGMLMGLANLVPGISGGTMLLAAGIYEPFLDAVSSLSRLRFRKDSLGFLGLVIGASLVAVLLLAGPIKELVIHQRWIMYSLFIGLTLGGVPVLWPMLHRTRPATWVGAAVGLGAMLLLALGSAGGQEAASEGGFGLFFVAGLAGASAMILPGISGGYLLLLLGAYVPLLAGIEAFREGLGALEWAALVDPGIGVLLPVGLGVLVGVAGVSNLLRWLLRKKPAPTLGLLLGLLVGAVAGLWPFRDPMQPQPGEIIKGQRLDAEAIAALPMEDWPLENFSPDAYQIGLALVLVGIGFGITLLIARVGDSSSRRSDPA